MRGEFFDRLPPTSLGSGTKSKADEGTEILSGLLSAIFSVAVLAGAYGLVALASFLLRTLQQNFPTTPSHPLFAAAIGGFCILIGRVLYNFRKHRKDIYALLEIGSAFGVAVEACIRLGKLDKTTDTSALLFALLGAVYIAVRGFDNIAAFKKEREGAFLTTGAQQKFNSNK